MKSNIFYFIFTIFLINILSIEIACKQIGDKNDEEEIIELKDLETPLPSPDDPDILYIPIIHTNDIHGTFYPKKILLPSKNLYSIGGLEYLAKYISIMKEEWKDRLLLFDTGDEFQGGLESHISQGKIIMDFFNELKIDNAVIGNHEFDNGFEFLKNYMNLSNFDWVIDNIRNLTSQEFITFPNQKKSTIIEIEGIKIGIIGLVTLLTPSSTNTEMPDLEFNDYLKIVNEESSKLRNSGVNAIIVIGHLGLSCQSGWNNSKFEYKLRDINSNQTECTETDEAFILLNKLKKGTIDLFLGGHVHGVAHHWINSIPYMSNDSNGKYTQIVYLPFDKKTKQLLNNKIIMEGPLPACEKLFKNSKLCDFIVITEEEEEQLGKLLNFKFHNQNITKDKYISKIGEKYKSSYDKYDKDILTVTYEHLASSSDKENALSNLYTDFLRHISGADISVVNPGSFRTPFYRGNITNATIYSFDPFANELVIFQAYGWEVKKMFYILQKGNRGFYPASGLKMVVRKQPTRKLISIKLYDGFEEKEIEENKLYSIISSEFCFPLEPEYFGGDDFETVYKWFRPRNGTYLKINNFDNSRDLFIDYLRKIDEIKGNKYFREEAPRLRILGK